MGVEHDLAGLDPYGAGDAVTWSEPEIPFERTPEVQEQIDKYDPPPPLPPMTIPVELEDTVQVFTGLMAVGLKIDQIAKVLEVSADKVCKYARGVPGGAKKDGLGGYKYAQILALARVVEEQLEKYIAEGNGSEEHKNKLSRSLIILKHRIKRSKDETKLYTGTTVESPSFRKKYNISLERFRASLRLQF